MKNEIAVVERLLRSEKTTVRRNETWDAICAETGAGSVLGKEIHFTPADKQRLREYIASESGLDPQFDFRAGGRMAMACLDANEKLTSDSVFGHLLVLATLGRATIKVDEEVTTTPLGCVLSILPNKIDLEHLKAQKLLVVENGAIMPYWGDFQLPVEWRNSVILYRGHRENMRTVADIARSQPEDNLGWFFDFDPAGLALGLDQGKGSLLVPDQWFNIDSSTGFNQPSKYRDQQVALRRIKANAIGDLIAIAKHMEMHSLAVMQEHLVQRNIALKAIRLGGIDT